MAIPDLPHRPDDVITVVTVLMPAATAVWEPPSAHSAVMVVPMRSIPLAGQTTAAAPQAVVRLAISTSGFVIRLDTKTRNGRRPGQILLPIAAPTYHTRSHAIATHTPWPPALDTSHRSETLIRDKFPTGGTVKGNALKGSAILERLRAAFALAPVV